MSHKDNRPTKVPVFAVSNDTDSLPVWKNKAGLPICETPFGDFELLKPNTKRKHRNFETGDVVEVTNKISDYKPIDLIGYINKRWFCWDNSIVRQRQIEDPLNVPVLERLDTHHRNSKITEMLAGLGVNRNLHQRKPLPY